MSGTGDRAGPSTANSQSKTAKEIAAAQRKTPVAMVCFDLLHFAGLNLRDNTCETAVEEDPALADCHYNLARLYESLAKPQHATRRLGEYRRLVTRKSLNPLEHRMPAQRGACTREWTDQVRPGAFRPGRA